MISHVLINDAPGVRLRDTIAGPRKQAGREEGSEEWGLQLQYEQHSRAECLSAEMFPLPSLAKEYPKYPYQAQYERNISCEAPRISGYITVMFSHSSYNAAMLSFESG